MPIKYIANKLYSKNSKKKDVIRLQTSKELKIIPRVLFPQTLMNDSATMQETGTAQIKTFQ